jgi:hypothetical protein
MCSEKTSCSNQNKFRDKWKEREIIDEILDQVPQINLTREANDNPILKIVAGMVVNVCTI